MGRFCSDYRDARKAASPEGGAKKQILAAQLPACPHGFTDTPQWEGNIPPPFALDMAMQRE
jgi:hypothetical protein